MSKQIKMTSKNGVTLYTGGKYVADDIHVIIDEVENLAAENIVKDVTILGVTGTYEGGSGGTPIELATSEEMEAVLVAENIGKIYKYVGETNETFKNNKLYEVIER